MTTPWRDSWDPLDPTRPCYTCGAPPSHYFDRQKNEPAYSCGSHAPIRGEHNEGRWSTRATTDEWTKAYRMARAIVKESEERGWKMKYLPRGYTEADLKARGFVAELVAARLTGLPHHKPGLSAGYRRRQKKADIGENVEVRNTQYHAGELPIYENDPEGRIVLLVTGIDPFILRGWIRVNRGLLRKFYKPRMDPPRWLVPQDILHPMDNLPEKA